MSQSVSVNEANSTSSPASSTGGPTSTSSPTSTAIPALSTQSSVPSQLTAINNQLRAQLLSSALKSSLLGASCGLGLSFLLFRRKQSKQVNERNYNF